MSKMQPIDLKNIELVILDMDGVILNIFDAIKRATMDMVSKFKLDVNPDQIMMEMALLIEKLQAIPIPKIILNAAELLKVSFLHDPTVIKTLEVAGYIYSQFKIYKENSTIYAGIDKIIKFLNAKGKKLAILTNNKKTSTVESLNKYGLTEFFNEIIGFNEVGKTKPEPDGLFKIMEMEGIKDGKKVLFVGDMKTDCQAGRSAKVKTIAVASGLCSREELDREKPDILVNNVAELGQLLGIAV